MPGNGCKTRVGLADQSSCPHTSPHRLTPSEVRTIEDMVTAPQYRDVPTGTLAILAQRLGTVWASPSTWYRLVRQHGWRRPRLRVHPAKPKVGLRTTRADEMWHIDTTVIRLLDGTRVYLHAVIDNFSRRILAWRVAETFAPVNSVVVLVEAGRGRRPQRRLRSCWRTRGVENVNPQVDDLIAAGVLRRVLAFTELKFSNSLIEAWWRSLTHPWWSSTRGTASPRSVDESRSTSRRTTRSFRMRRFAARRRTRCISAPGTRCQPTWRQARPPPDGPAWRPTDQRPAGRAPQSTRPPDHRQRPVCRPPRPAAPSIWERRREQPGTTREHE